MALAWSKDLESYAGSNVATGRVSHAGQVKDAGPDEKGYVCHPGYGLHVRLTTLSREKKNFAKKSSGRLGPRRGCNTIHGWKSCSIKNFKISHS